jgi:hypothetical protein
LAVVIVPATKWAAVIPDCAAACVIPTTFGTVTVTDPQWRIDEVSIARPIRIIVEALVVSKPFSLRSKNARMPKKLDLLDLTLQMNCKVQVY